MYQSCTETHSLCMHACVYFEGRTGERKRERERKLKRAKTGVFSCLGISFCASVSSSLLGRKRTMNGEGSPTAEERFWHEAISPEAQRFATARLYPVAG